MAYTYICAPRLCFFFLFSRGVLFFGKSAKNFEKSQKKQSGGGHSWHTPSLYSQIVFLLFVFSRFFGCLGKVQKTSRKPPKKIQIWWGTFLAYTYICAPRLCFFLFVFSRCFGFLGKVQKTSRKPKKKQIWWGTFLAYTYNICAPRLFLFAFCFLEVFFFVFYYLCWLPVLSAL